MRVCMRCARVRLRMHAYQANEVQHEKERVHAKRTQKEGEMQAQAKHISTANHRRLRRRRHQRQDPLALRVS